jgi:hypothetical protein
MLRDPQISQFSLRIPRSLAAGSSGGLPLRGTGRQAGREGGRERGDRARAAFEIFRSCPNQRPGICTDDFLFFYFFGPFLFSFSERWEVSHPGDPPKKKKKKILGANYINKFF